MLNQISDFRHPRNVELSNNSNELSNPPPKVWAERLVGSFLHELSSPQLLLGMTAAGMAGRLGRLGGGLWARGQGWGGLGLWASSRGAGLLTEAGAFSATTVAVSGLTVGHASPGFAETFRSSLLMFASLGAARGLVGGNSLGQVLGACYGGILGNHLLQQNVLHWEETQPWSTLLAETLAETITFTAGAHLAGSLLGKPLVPLNRGLDMAIGRVEGRRSPLMVDLLETADSRVKVPSIYWDWGRIFPQSTYMKSRGKGGGGGKRITGITGSFLKPEEPGKVNPFELNHPLQFTRRMAEAELNFAERLEQGDVEFVWKVSESIEPHLELYLSVLNKFAKRQGLDQPRKVHFKIGEDPLEPGFTLIKTASDRPFIRMEDGMETPVVPSSPEALASARKIASINPSSTSQSRTFFVRAQEILSHEIEGLPARPEESSTSSTNTKMRTPLNNARELWDEVIHWIRPQRSARLGSSEQPDHLSAEAAMKEIYYIPETPVTEMDLNQMRSILIYIPEGHKLRIHDVTGNSTWEIWTEFGDPKIKKMGEPKE